MSEQLASLGNQWGLIAVVALVMCIWLIAIDKNEDD